MKSFIYKCKSFMTLTVIIASIFIFITTEIDTTKSSSKTDVTLSIIPTPNIDIVLAKSKTSTNVTSFDNDLLDALEEVGVDTKKVQISSVSTENINMQNAFSWNKDLSSSIGAITITDSGTNVEMVGNATKAGKNAIYILATGNYEQKFTFDYNIDYGDSFNAAGMLLKVKKIGSELTGYMLSFNKSGKSYYTTSGNKLGAIWKFRWTIGTNTTSLSCLASTATLSANSCVLVKDLEIDVQGTLNVSVNNSYIEISGGGLAKNEKIDIDDDSNNIGFGFFADHYSHNCSRIGSFALTGINLQKITVKKMSEVLREPEFRNDAIKVVVNINDYESEELQSNSSMGELLTRLINENLKFVAWGKNGKNETQYKNLINANNGNGIFINNTEYANSINQTAGYIRSLVDELKGEDNYLILGEEIKISSNPANLLENTAGGVYPYGRWKIIHNYQYFENNIGQFDKANQYLNDMVKEFDKTGEYIITYEDKEITPQTIYVHRRPIAIINHSKEELNLNLSSASYDLDSYSKENNGITEEEWKYKKTTDEDWTVGKLATLEENANYIIQLKVKDYQGAWSTPESVYTTNDQTTLPIASFKIENDEISKYEELKINDTSYDPYGGEIISRTWNVYKEGIKVYSGSTPKVEGYTGTGVYVMQLQVTNDRNLKSEVYSRTFQIVEDISAPTILITPESCNWKKEIDVNVSFEDLQSGFKNYEYAITNSQLPITDEKWNSAKTKNNDTIKISSDGNNYLHIRATDNAGNVSAERITGIYKIDRNVPNIEFEQDTSTKFINNMTVKFYATDSQSGIKSFTINGKDITSERIKFLKNGTFTIEAEDNVGWKTSKEITINNIYYKCNAGLEHPDYSSSYNVCPICESYKGLNITKDTNIYDGNSHRVQYDNQKVATIIEYYNDSKLIIPTKVGNYRYELKVIYEGNEYKTGITGIYSVTKKDITISGIETLEKIYDGNTQMTATSGKLHGVCKEDAVEFILPNVVYSESKNVGTHKIRLTNDILLKGEDAYNYNLIQPTYGSITGNITKRNITVSGVQGKTKKYNENNIMEIIGGTIVNSVSGDDILINVPKTGIAESANVGEWKILINDIELQGKDAKNYTLIQPNDVKGIIEKADGVLKIKCDDKIYDNTYVTPYVIQNNSTSNVTYKFYKENTNEEIENPKDVGKYEVIGCMSSDGNYTEITTERIKFEIIPKDITIIDIEVADKIYNGTKNFNVTGGKLIGIYEEDDVKFILPYLGSAESKNVGTYAIKLNEIILTGEQASNYNLIQPIYGSITANILKKQISTQGIYAINKKYDTTNTVSIAGGELIGVVNNDDVNLKVPSEGTAEHFETGNWIVQMENVTIEGNDANNYEIIQPEKFYVKIEKADGNVKIACNNKKFDRNAIEPYVNENNSEGNVTFEYYIAGTTQKVEQPFEIGKYDIIAILEETDNYTKCVSEKITVEITNPDNPNLKVESIVSEVNSIETTETQIINVQYTDTFKVKIKVKNTGIGSGYLSKVLLTIPEGIEFVENSNINQKYQWRKNDKTVESNIFSIENNFENELYNNEYENSLHFVELEIELKAINNSKQETSMNILIEIEQQNKHGDKIEYTDKNNEDNISKININYVFFDVSIKNNISKIDIVNKLNQKTEKLDINNKNKVAKVELSKEKISKSYATVNYEIILTNEGTTIGKVEQIIDILPKGILFETKDNPNWKINVNGNIYYDEQIELQPNETKTVQLLLKWELGENELGTRKNQCFILAKGEIDEMLIAENKQKITETNNYNFSELLIYVNTGGINIYIIILLVPIMILTIGIILIKKLVLK